MRDPAHLAAALRVKRGETTLALLPKEQVPIVHDILRHREAELRQYARAQEPARSHVLIPTHLNRVRSW